MTATLYNTFPISRNPKDGIQAYYECSLCGSVTIEHRSEHAIPDRVRCTLCDNREKEA